MRLSSAFLLTTLLVLTDVTLLPSSVSGQDQRPDQQTLPLLEEMQVSFS